MGPMSHATTAPSPIHATRPNQVAVGTIVWLSSELMFFAGLFAMYFTLRAQVPEVWADRTELLNIPFATANTAILVLSSFTAQAGVFGAERYQRRRTGSLLNVWFSRRARTKRVPGTTNAADAMDSAGAASTADRQ